VDQLKSAKDKEDEAGMKKAMKEVETISQEIGKKIYEKASAAGQPGDVGGTGGDSAGGSPDDAKGEGETIIDADYEVKD
jgi:hypothetical protein